MTYSVFMCGIKKFDGQSTVNEIENKDLLFISYEKKIPKSYRNIVSYLYKDEYGDMKVDKTMTQMEIPDPSTIYAYLPIIENYHAKQLQHLPNYIDISPEQRFTYLNWLKNIDNPIDEGYVLLYYYGLERHLLVGNFEKAFFQIIRLRKVHKYSSFQLFSELALIHSCMLLHRMDMLAGLHEKTEITGFSNTHLLLAYQLKKDISVQNLLDIFDRSFKLSRKPLKENYKLFENCTREILNDTYGSEGFPIKNYDISITKTTVERRFANYTFPNEIQLVDIPDFFQCEPFMADIKHVFRLAYEKYKKHKAFERKKLKIQLRED